MGVKTEEGFNVPILALGAARGVTGAWQDS